MTPYWTHFVTAMLALLVGYFWRIGEEQRRAERDSLEPKPQLDPIRPGQVWEFTGSRDPFAGSWQVTVLDVQQGYVQYAMGERVWSKDEDGFRWCYRPRQAADIVTVKGTEP